MRKQFVKHQCAGLSAWPIRPAMRLSAWPIRRIIECGNTALFGWEFTALAEAADGAVRSFVSAAAP